MTKDILIYESGDGGELQITNNDISLIETLYQQVYLALFGGNTEESTTNSSIESEERFDYWGNDLYWNTSPNKQFNSQTERVLKNVPLNVSGRLQILQAVENDLKYLSGVVNVSSDVVIISKSRAEINIAFVEIQNQQEKQFQIVYDNATNETIINIVI